MSTDVSEEQGRICPGKCQRESRSFSYLVMLINFRVVAIDVMLTDMDIITICFIRRSMENPENVDTNLDLKG
jgi:hypothetical protein